MDRHLLEVIQRLEAIAARLESKRLARTGRPRVPSNKRLRQAWALNTSLRRENRRLHKLLEKELEP